MPIIAISLFIFFIIVSLSVQKDVPIDPISCFCKQFKTGLSQYGMLISGNRYRLPITAGWVSLSFPSAFSVAPAFALVAPATWILS